MPKMEKLPEITHAEVIRKLQLEIERIGSTRAAARYWGISPALLAFIMRGERNVGPKLLRKLGLKRVTLTVHRYKPIAGGKRVQYFGKPGRVSELAKTSHL